VFCIAITYIIFAFVVTMATQAPALGNLLPHWNFQPFDPNDKTNLAPYWVMHLIALAVVVTRFLAADSPILQWRALAPVYRLVIFNDQDYQRIVHYISPTAQPKTCLVAFRQKCAKVYLRKRFHLGEVIFTRWFAQSTKSSGGARIGRTPRRHARFPAHALFIPKPYIGRTIIDAIRTFEKM
jgi:hypothetical protein